MNDRALERVIGAIRARSAAGPTPALGPAIASAELALELALVDVAAAAAATVLRLQVCRASG